MRSCRVTDLSVRLTWERKDASRYDSKVLHRSDSRVQSDCGLPWRRTAGLPWRRYSPNPHSDYSTAALAGVVKSWSIREGLRRRPLLDDCRPRCHSPAYNPATWNSLSNSPPTVSAITDTTSVDRRFPPYRPLNDIIPSNIPIFLAVCMLQIANIHHSLSIAAERRAIFFWFVSLNCPWRNETRANCGSVLVVIVSVCKKRADHW